MIKNKHTPFEFKNGNLHVPVKYKEAFIDDERPTSFSPKNYEYYRQLLASYYWMDCWYRNQDWTIPSEKIGECTIINNNIVCDIDESSSKFEKVFIRLNSVSPKDVEVKKDKVYDLITESKRCISSINMATSIQRPIYIYSRKWVDLSKGCEFRIFVYNMRIVAISSSDNKICELNNSEIIQRCHRLFTKCKFDIPLPDICIDVWLCDKFSDRDIVIEFNSYGSWGNSSSELFDWQEDCILFAGLANDIEIRRNPSYE